MDNKKRTIMLCPFSNRRSLGLCNSNHSPSHKTHVTQNIHVKQPFKHFTKDSGTQTADAERPGRPCQKLIDDTQIVTQHIVQSLKQPVTHHSTDTVTHHAAHTPTLLGRLRSARLKPVRPVTDKYVSSCTKRNNADSAPDVSQYRDKRQLSAKGEKRVVAHIDEQMRISDLWYIPDSDARSERSTNVTRQTSSRERRWANFLPSNCGDSTFSASTEDYFDGSRSTHYGNQLVKSVTNLSDQLFKHNLYNPPKLPKSASFNSRCNSSIKNRILHKIWHRSESAKASRPSMMPSSNFSARPVTTIGHLRSSDTCMSHKRYHTNEATTNLSIDSDMNLDRKYEISRRHRSLRPRDVSAKLRGRELNSRIKYAMSDDVVEKTKVNEKNNDGVKEEIEESEESKEGEEIEESEEGCKPFSLLINLPTQGDDDDDDDRSIEDISQRLGNLGGMPQCGDKLKDSLNSSDRGSGYDGSGVNGHQHGCDLVHHEHESSENNGDEFESSRNIYIEALNMNFCDGNNTNREGGKEKFIGLFEYGVHRKNANVVNNNEKYTQNVDCDVSEAVLDTNMDNYIRLHGYSSLDVSHIYKSLAGFRYGNITTSGNAETAARSPVNGAFVDCNNNDICRVDYHNECIVGNCNNALDNLNNNADDQLSSCDSLERTTPNISPGSSFDQLETETRRVMLEVMDSRASNIRKTNDVLQRCEAMFKKYLKREGCYSDQLFQSVKPTRQRSHVTRMTSTGHRYLFHLSNNGETHLKLVNDNNAVNYEISQVEQTNASNHLTHLFSGGCLSDSDSVCISSGESRPSSACVAATITSLSEVPPVKHPALNAKHELQGRVDRAYKIITCFDKIIKEMDVAPGHAEGRKIPNTNDAKGTFNIRSAQISTDNDRVGTDDMSLKISTVHNKNSSTNGFKEETTSTSDGLSELIDNIEEKLDMTYEKLRYKYEHLCYNCFWKLDTPRVEKSTENENVVQVESSGVESTVGDDSPYRNWDKHQKKRSKKLENNTNSSLKIHHLMSRNKNQRQIMPMCFYITARPLDGYLYYFAYGTHMNPNRMQTYLGREVTPRLWGLLFGFELRFNKIGKDKQAGLLPNLSYAPQQSTEGCTYLISHPESCILDNLVGYPQHFDKVMLPVWMLNCSRPSEHGVAQYCVPALTYIAQDEWVSKDTHACVEAVFNECLTASDLLTPCYKHRLLNLADCAKVTTKL